MSGTKQTEFTLSGQSTDWSKPDAARIYIERIMEPTFKKVRNTVNQLARDILATSVSTNVAAKYGLVLVDATTGPVTLTLVTPAANFHPITVVKTDSSSHSVVVQASGAALISGSATDTFSKQWEVTQYESDGLKYVRTFGGNMSLFGDVTGTADNNTVSKLQGVTLTASGGNAPRTGQVLMYNGTVWLPVSRNIVPLAASFSPVGCWNFNKVTGTNPIPDLSGNGYDLALETGTSRGIPLHPTVGGMYFDGATNYVVNVAQPKLKIVGELTVLTLFMWIDLPAAGTPITMWSQGAPGETSDTNCLYLGNIDNLSQFNWFSEHGAGINDIANTLSVGGRVMPFLNGITRDLSGNLKYWADGLFRGVPFGTITMPTDGSNTKFRVGADNTGAQFFKGIITSVSVYDKVLTDEQMLALYNDSLGGAFGLK